MIIFKIIGYKFSIFLSGKIFTFFGPLFRSNEISQQNLNNALPHLDKKQKKKNFKKNVV